MIEYKINGEVYATNNDGTGLFIWEKTLGGFCGEYKQLVGNCDFTTANVKNPRAKIVRWLKEDN